MGAIKWVCGLLVAIAASFGTISGETMRAPTQAFSSGSTGSDGALNLANLNCPDLVWGYYACYVQLPPSGVLNYTTIDIPNDRALHFIRNLKNTPVYLLAQGAVTVQGPIEVSSKGDRTPGPGGFFGGTWKNSQAFPGLGPGGGSQSGAGGTWVGPLSLVPLIGGSGGSGAYCQQFPHIGADGTGGGGAIVIASSSSVTVTYSGSVSADGGSGYNNSCVPIGWGSGGAVRLVANSLTVAGRLSAGGGCNTSASCSKGGGASTGVVRLEAPSGALSFTGSSYPAAVLSTVNPAILTAVQPSLTILSVGGYAVPAYSGQRFDTVDLLLPMQLPDPINIVVAASNIPVGTQVQLQFGTNNQGNSTPGVLSGSTASSSATLSVSGLNRAQLAYLFVSSTFSVPQGAQAGNPPGPNQVAQVRASAPPGGATQFAFLRKDGSRIDERDVPQAILRQFRR